MRNMRSHSAMKYFVLLAICVFAFITFKMVTYNELYSAKGIKKAVGDLKTIYDNKNSRNETPKRKMFYILQWTSPDTVPFVYMGKGRQGFIDRHCPYTNCYVTSNRTLLGNYTNFDVIAFAGPQLSQSRHTDLPKYRSPHQKYVFASIESAENYPVCSDRYNNFFNWTWTYKLDSESKWGYIVIRDNSGFVVGPKTDMNWIPFEYMIPTPDGLKMVLKRKKKLVAWFVSNCKTRSKRENFVRDLNRELAKYNYSVDIYGECGDHKCPRDNETVCDELIRRDYRFYLSLENSFSEDYVTEKLIHAVGYNAIPIVYGGANYSRFLPPHSYLDARKLSVEEIAKIMTDLDSYEEYIDYFRWTRYYSYHTRAHSAETDDYCGFCILLNDKTKVETRSVYGDFLKWWNKPDACSTNA